MATPLDVAPGSFARTDARRGRRRSAVAGRALLAVAAVVGVLLSTVPAQASPPTVAAAGDMVAAKGRELEAFTEKFNAAREALGAAQAAARAAAAQLEQAN